MVEQEQAYRDRGWPRRISGLNMKSEFSQDQHNLDLIQKLGVHGDLGVVRISAEQGVQWQRSHPGTFTTERVPDGPEKNLLWA
jgi:hypothetical protein